MPLRALLLLPLLPLLASAGGCVPDTQPGWTALHSAVHCCDRAAVEEVLDRQGGAALLHARSASGDTPLHFAAQDNPEVVALLVRRGAPVNARDGRGDTPLHLAALYGHREAAAFLLAHGEAQVNARNRRGKTPLGYALEDGRGQERQAMIALLRRHGAVQ